MDIHMMQMLLPVGMYACFHGDPSARHPVGGLDREKAAVLAPGEFPPSDAKIFALFFACFALYFSGVMIRLMLVLAPIACVMGGIAMSAALQRFSARLKSFVNNHDEDLPIMQSIAFLVTIVVLLAFYSYHAVWVSDVAYSSPSIVLAQYTKDGRVLYDVSETVSQFLGNESYAPRANSVQPRTDALCRTTAKHICGSGEILLQMRASCLGGTMDINSG
eukprot:SAG31_NODE_225_length_19846_cov_19.057983_26_plen_219_part_00